jgi:hypothetical protein
MVVWLALGVGSMAALAQEPVTLWVAVHRAAGTIYDVAADGAAGQCSVADQTIHCPADGPVTFRWGPASPYELVGDTVLAPGGQGTATVWARDGSRAEARERVRPERVTPEDVRDIFVRTGDHPIDVPSAALFDDLLALAEHPDPKVRREVVDSLMPYWRHTASDPLPPGAPAVVAPTVLVALAQDDEIRVRRRTAFWMRDVRDPELSASVTVLLLGLAGEGGSVQRTAFASLSARARDGRTPALQTWAAALGRVSTPGPPGRAAANTLGALAAELQPGDVDAREAIELVAAHHLERTWVVWRQWSDAVPFDAELAERLLRQTVGMSPPLVRAWADGAPADLAALLRRWEPRRPHSERYRMVARILADHSAAEIRAVLDDSLSADAPDGGPE